MPLLRTHKWQYVFIFYSLDKGWCKVLYLKKIQGAQLKKGKLHKKYGPLMGHE